MRTKLRNLLVASTALLAALVVTSAVQADTGFKAHARTLDEIKASGELVVAVYINYRPFSELQNGAEVGVDADIANAVAKELGVKVSFKQVRPGDSVDEDLRNAIWKGGVVDRSVADVMMHIPTDPALVELVDNALIFGAYFQEQLAVAYKTGDYDPADGVEPFRKRPVSVEMGSVADMALMLKDHGALIANIHHFKTVQEAVAVMKKGEVPVVMGVRSELEEALRDARSAYQITQISVPWIAHTTWGLGVAVESSNKSLKTELAAVIDRLKANGTIAKIFADHGITFVAP